jgi:hypothetical protein
MRKGAYRHLAACIRQVDSLPDTGDAQLGMNKIRTKSDKSLAIRD